MFELKELVARGDGRGDGERGSPLVGSGGMSGLTAVVEGLGSVLTEALMAAVTVTVLTALSGELVLDDGDEYSGQTDAAGSTESR